MVANLPARMWSRRSAIILILLVCVTRLCLAQVQIDLDCRQGWELDKQNCYRLFTNLLPWSSAERTCNSYGGHLATPFDYYENEDIGKFVNNRGVNEFWIGANRVGVPPNDNRVLRYNGGMETNMWIGYWSVYQPKFSDGDCIYITKDKRQLHKWSFGSCEMSTAFLCQRPVCAKGSFHCLNGKCISPKSKCDGYDDCGDKSDETDCLEKCSVYIRTSVNGTIIYPSLGSSYPNNADCSWLIETDLDTNVHLTVNSLSLESNSDELIVIDGVTESNSMEIVRLTGQPVVPKHYYSSNNMMLLKFRSDGSVSNTGFSLAYDQVNSSQQSRSILTARNMWQEQGFLYYDNYVLGNLDLSYVIEADDPRQTVSIEILVIDLPADATVIIRNGKSVSDSVLTVLTGTFKGNGVALSTGRYLYIALHTVRGSQQQGLKFKYMQGCGAHINQSTGYITSPGYPVSFYPNNVTCTWTVNVPDAKNVTIYFNILDVHISDIIQIKEGSSILGNYSGKNVQNPVKVIGGQFSVIFTSNAILNSQGFNLTYSIDCPVPVIDISLSDITGTLSVFYGSDFTVSCKQGSRFTQAEHLNKTSVNMKCLAYGLWNVNTSPKCERIRCPKAPGVLNGYVNSSTGNMALNGTIHYKCDPGFRLTGSDTVMCDVSGQWVNPPTCQASVCGDARAADPFGTRNIIAGDGTSFGSIIRYSCNEGYELIGDSTLFCESNGTWIGIAGTCKILTCFKDSILNGNLSSKMVQVGQNITATCNPGYRSATGETNMTCNSNRTLTPMIFCQNINECEDNRTCQHRCTDTEGSYYCTCSPGYQVNGNSCRDINECVIGSPCNGTCTNTEGSYECSCPAGYSLFVANGTQGYYIPRTENGMLAGDVYRFNNSCVRNICMAPPNIANTDLLSLMTSYHYEDRIMYKCRLGYILENSMAGTLSCGENGNWTGLEIKCLRATCAVDPVPSNLINPGTVSFSSNMNIGFGEEIIINCSRPGFTPQTFSRRRKCTLIGQTYRLDGSVNDYECGFITCGKPPDEPGSIYTGPSGYNFNSSFTFSCLPGFKFDGASVMSKNNIVFCQSNGQWDFGNLTCTGIQCSDPGQPYLGQQNVSSDYRQGQLITFSCLISGYTISPPYPLSCVGNNGTVRINGSLPTCIDTQRPNITNCPQNEIFVDRQRSVGSMVPELQFQDNGGIKSLSVTPAWPSSQYYITSAVTPVEFNYTFADYGNNLALCTIRLRRKDDTPPTITCPPTRSFLFTSDNDFIYVDINRTMVIVKDDVTPSDQLKVTFSLMNYTFNARLILEQSFPLTRYEVISARVEDAAGNSAFCNFGLYFRPDLCSPYYIRTPPNANKVCTPAGLGYNCTITCNPGFVLYNSISANSVTKTCSAPGMAFPPDPDIKCVNLTSLDGSYKLEYLFTYDGPNISNSCRGYYENTISFTLKELTKDKTVITDPFCNTGAIFVTGNITLGSLSINEAEQTVVVRYIINFDRRPGSKYSTCANSVKLIMEEQYSYKQLTVFAPLVCENITLSTNKSQQLLVYNGYYCEDSRSQLVSTSGPESLSYCLTCPEGTYSSNNICVPCPVGTYNNMPNMNMCQPCLSTTSTYSIGAVSPGECASECVAGSISDGGLPPCTLCPKNTYWMNATTCMNCSSNRITRTTGAKNEDECKVPCQPGTFNDIDGHAECQSCPMHSYSNQMAALSCTECGFDEYTNSSGKTSIGDCLKLNQSQCLCQHGRCEQQLGHVRSCVCDDGWYGEYCNKSFDPCASHPCYNGGMCFANAANYTCSCLQGTSGQRCEQIIQTCTADYCQNNGMCENLVNMPRCHCLPGYTGERCQSSQDVCAAQPCKNGGVCTSFGNIRFSCSCDYPFSGSTCEQSRDDCYESPCRNNGTCRDGFNNCACDCDSSYMGQYCETYKQMCSPGICGPGAKCVEDEVNSTYICVCSDNTEQSSGGMSCKIKDFCARNPCMNNGSCVSSGSSFTCTCPAGFGGSRCQHNINSCLSKPCENGGRCQDLLGTFYCNCSGTNYRGDSCNIPVDNCESGPCNANSTDACFSVSDAYYCRCTPGYTGRLCEIDVNDCSSNPCLRNAKCLDMMNGYMCQCPVGWTGKNCETEIKLCSNTTCFNGAMCYDYFNGYFCKCGPNTYDKNCAGSVEICKVANPCVHGLCQDMSGTAKCTCDNDYEGDQCELRQNYCAVNKSICKNGGQCIPQLDNYECKCPKGYALKDCSYDEDQCSRSSCPVGATCYNFEDSVYCRCPLDKEGPNCDKAWDQDFDLLFDNEHRTDKAYLPYPIKLNSSSFSISIWLQFGKVNDMGTFLSVLTVPKSNSLRGKHLLLWIDEKTIYYNSNGTVISFTHDIRYNDGMWHYLVVNVDRNTGVLHFIVDTINSMPVNITVSETAENNIWLALGALWDSVSDMPVKDKGFYGKLSRVTVYSRELSHRDEVTIVGNNNVSSLFMDSILRWSSEFKYSIGVTRLAPSMADRTCPFGFTDYPNCTTLLPGKKLVKIASGQCPGDIIQFSSNRLTQVFWPGIPTFTGQDTQKSSWTSGDTFTWGKYPVEIAASNADGNTLLCLFNIFVQNDNCAKPEDPPLAETLQCTPNVYEKYKQCGLTCQNNTAPSIASPRIFTCGPVGNWDPENRFVPYRITPCGAITQPKNQLVINLRYSVLTMECSAVKETLNRELLKTQVNLNNQWNRVCTQTNCSDTVIEVKCLNKRRKRQATTSNKLDLDVTLILNDILNTVVSRSDNSMKTTEDLYRDLILSPDSANPFDYSRLVAGAKPELNSVNTIPLCDAPKVLQENQCVDCGPGTFYNGTEKECQFCAIGSYQPLSAQTSCIPCNKSTTTATIGSYKATDCYMECSPGQYMNLMNGMSVCTNCSRGLYQPQSGQFSCLACPAHKTTKYTGTVLATDCSNDCPPGLEIGSSNNCTDCRIGFYRGVNDPFCQRCPNGTVTQNMTETDVSACNVADNPPGTKRRQNDPKESDLCPVGTYQSLRWQYDCISCDTNYLTDNEGSTNITDCKFSCPAGQEKKQNEDSCVPCAFAFYRDGSKPFDLCASCPGHFTTLTMGSTSAANCTLYRCKEGEQPNSMNNGCEPCPNGTYQELPDKTSCNPCSSGNSTRNTGAKKQADCESYCPSGQEKNGSLCLDCHIGYFKDNKEDLFGMCILCKNSSFVTPGMGSVSNDNCTVLNCVEGYKTNQTAQTCDPCPVGTYQDKKYQNNCILCAQNLTTRHANSTKLSDCETYCHSGYEKIANICSPCPRGYYKDNTIDVFMACTACDSKYVTPEGSPATNASQCTVRNCPAGSYIDGDNCTSCAQGYFQDKPWQTSCIQCGPNRNTEKEGASSSDMCLLSCPAGLENNGNSTTCDPCAVGFYKDVAAAAKCTPCANLTENDIYISTENGSTSKSNCTKFVCLAGYQPVNNICTMCDFGAYQPNRWSDSCISCPPNNTTYMRGSISSSDCEYNCSVGEELVNGTCRKCVIGLYNDKSVPSSKECLVCPAGKITQQEGATSAMLCNITDCSALGQYRDVNDNSCKNCSIGTYQDNIRQDMCKMCPTGYTTQHEKSTSVTDCLKDCDSGTHLDVTTNSCVPCPTGSYRNKTEGTWDCVSCGNKLTTLSTGSDKASDCSVAYCDPGYAYYKPNQTCSPCPLNTYTAGRGQFWPCTSCPDGQVTTREASNSPGNCLNPCSTGDKCDIVKQVCVNVQSSYRCDCRSEYFLQNSQCIHKCEIPNYCGSRGDCIRSPFECRCRDGYTGGLCDIRPDASTMSDNETETIIIAVVTTVSGVLFLILLVVCICVMARRRRSVKTPRTSEIDEHTSIATRSVKGYDDYPTFAVNPAFSSKPPSIFNGPNGALPAQGFQMYNPTYAGDEDGDPAVYRA